MRLTQEIAVIGLTIGFGGMFGTEIASHQKVSSRAAAITARVCELDYGSSAHPESITKDTIDCMNNGWVPEGRTLHPNLKAGDDTELLHGYERIEAARGRHFNATAPLLSALIGLGIGLWIINDENKPERDEPEPREPQDEVEPDPEAEPSKD
jgi:hypothetical protein